MKITLILLLTTAFSAFSMDVHSQNAKVSLDTNIMKVAQLISAIESQTNYLFVYSKKNVDLSRKVKINAKNKAVSEILDEVFSGTGITYVMEGKNIVLTKESNIAREEVKQQNTITVKGAITDMQGEAIIGANIIQQGTTNGTITDIDGNFTLEVPADAQLDDETFAAMLAEAQKYIGYPYVWGGSSPATSFDCSGYVSWVINHSGWNVGRLGAQGLYNICTPTSSPKPGDLVFFKGTYDTPGVSHCGIYVGDGKMLHCGDPIGYANLNTSYWQSHFYAYGRLP